MSPNWVKTTMAEAKTPRATAMVLLASNDSGSLKGEMSIGISRRPSLRELNDDQALTAIAHEQCRRVRELEAESGEALRGGSNVSSARLG